MNPNSFLNRSHWAQTSPPKRNPPCPTPSPRACSKRNRTSGLPCLPPTTPGWAPWRISTTPGAFQDSISPTAAMTLLCRGCTPALPSRKESTSWLFWNSTQTSWWAWSRRRYRAARISQMISLWCVCVGCWLPCPWLGTVVLMKISSSLGSCSVFVWMLIVMHLAWSSGLEEDLKQSRIMCELCWVQDNVFVYKILWLAWTISLWVWPRSLVVKINRMISFAAWDVMFSNSILISLSAGPRRSWASRLSQIISLFW